MRASSKTRPRGHVPGSPRGHPKGPGPRGRGGPDQALPRPFPALKTHSRFFLHPSPQGEGCKISLRRRCPDEGQSHPPRARAPSPPLPLRAQARPSSPHGPRQARRAHPGDVPGPLFRKPPPHPPHPLLLRTAPRLVRLPGSPVPGKRLGEPRLGDDPLLLRRPGLPKGGASRASGAHPRDDDPHRPGDHRGLRLQPGRLLGPSGKALLLGAGHAH